MTSEELKIRQGWPLAHKIDHALATIDQFISKLDGKVFVSFSGGKDSTVLLDLCRVIKPDILAVFSNTGNEHPDIVRFVTSKIKAGENIRIIRPKMTPRQVWAKYGFPLVSKETAYKVHSCRINPNSGRVVNKFLNNDSKYRIALKWRYLIDEDYETSNSCCDKLKKEPFHRFILESGLSPIVGVMACESEQRRGRYLRDGGCNTFINNGLGGKSKPLSIWLEQDIWDYINHRHLPIADIYHKGAQRTGCVGCGFGCQYADDNRLELLYNLYPKYYQMVMNYTNNGVTYREAIRKVLATVGLFLPDERPKTLFDYGVEEFAD